jgi:hypothetical protein
MPSISLELAASTTYKLQATLSTVIAGRDNPNRTVERRHTLVFEVNQLPGETRSTGIVSTKDDNEELSHQNDAGNATYQNKCMA